MVIQAKVAQGLPLFGFWDLAGRAVQLTKITHKSKHTVMQHTYSCAPADAEIAAHFLVQFFLVLMFPVKVWSIQQV
jgi:hypothetical protein